MLLYRMNESVCMCVFVPQLIGAVGLAPALMLAREGQIPHTHASVLSLVKGQTHMHKSCSVNVHLVAHSLNNYSHTLCEQTRSRTHVSCSDVSVL